MKGMIERGPATEDEMIAAFLQAEIEASRYGDAVIGCLAMLGAHRSLIDAPNLGRPEENATRLAVLGAYRGYPDKFLFTGFPSDVVWRRVQLAASDWSAIRYAKYETLEKLSGGTRRIADGVRIFDQSPTDHPDMAHIPAVRAEFRNGKRFAPLILVQANDDTPVILEGHTRATVYVMVRYGGLVDAFVGSSPAMSGWWLY